MKKLLFLYLIFCVTGVSAQLCFNPATSYAAGTQSYGVTNADFNGDGKIDLATANSNSNEVSVLLGTGTGTFGTATSFTIGGTNPTSIVSADFNGDGKIDLATCNANTNDVSVLLGMGTGSFGAATSFTVGTWPYSLCSKDFNNDGNADLAVANSGSNNFSILLGTGTGTFGTANNFLVGINPRFIISEDLNGDNNADIVVCNYNSGNLTVILGNGTGTFGSGVTYATGMNPNAVTIADLNGDSNQDLAAVNYGSSGASDVLILLGAAGTFSTVTTFTAGLSATSICSADFDGDTKLDLAVATNSLCAVQVLLGSGSGNFGPTNDFTVHCNTWATGIITDDFNGDGKADIAVSSGTWNDVSILLSCSGVDVATFSKEHNISIYPNPTNGKFNIEMPTQLGAITIYNSLGEQVYKNKTQNQNFEIDISNLPSGIYILHVQNRHVRVVKE